MSSSLRNDAMHGDLYACLAMTYFYHTGKEVVQNTHLALE